MTEAEILELLNLYASNGINSFALYITFTSTYLVAVYSVGSKLSRFQACAIAVLYIVASSAPALTCLTHTQSLQNLASQHPKLLHSPLWLFPWANLIPIILASGILVGLYFLYDIRRKSHT